MDLPRLIGISQGLSSGPEPLRSALFHALQGGLRFVLIREPRMGLGVLERVLNELGPEFERCVIHEKTPGVHAALAADPMLGVHVPSDRSIEPWLGRVRGPIGKSTHSVEQARAAIAAGADYVLLSPVFRSVSKPLDTRNILGLDPFGSLRGLQVYGLGGIVPANIPSVLAAGAAGVASLGGLFGDGDGERIASHTRSYIDALNRPRLQREPGTR